MKEEPFRVLGIDPGLRALGYGVIEAHGRNSRLITYGVVQTQSTDPFSERLKQLYEGVSQVIAEFEPAYVSFEKLIYAKNVTIALQLGQARGAAILAAANQGLPMSEYNPTEIKSAVVGKGRAGKTQIQHMVKVLLGLQDLPEPNHAADALAAALTFVHSKQVHLQIQKHVRR